MDIYKSVRVSIGTVMKNLEILKFVNKKMCKNAVKKLPFLIRCVHDQDSTNV